MNPPKSQRKDLLGFILQNHLKRTSIARTTSVSWSSRKCWQLPLNWTSCSLVIRWLCKLITFHDITQTNHNYTGWFEGLIILCLMVNEHLPWLLACWWTTEICCRGYGTASMFNTDTNCFVFFRSVCTDKEINLNDPLHLRPRGCVYRLKELVCASLICASNSLYDYWTSEDFLVAMFYTIVLHSSRSVSENCSKSQTSVM